MYEYDDSIIRGTLTDHKGKPVEISEHRKDGKTDAYEYDDSIIRGTLTDHKGDQKNKTEGCFLTTACVQFGGLSDNCHELMVLRGFRDRYVSHLPGGASLMSEYYATAPTIVQAIDRAPNRSELLSDMLTEDSQYCGQH